MLGAAEGGRGDRGSLSGVGDNAVGLVERRLRGSAVNALESKGALPFRLWGWGGAQWNATHQTHFA